MINIWLLYDYFTTVLDYIYNVLRVLVFLTRKVGIGLTSLFSPKHKRSSYVKIFMLTKSPRALTSSYLLCPPLIFD